MILHSLVRIAATLAAVYLLVCLAAYLFQDRLLYYPSSRLELTPEHAGMPYEPVSFEAEDGVRLSGWSLPCPGSSRTLFVCHGNAGNISHRLHVAAAFHQIGWNVLLFDYRGYGESAGRPDESGLYRDAAAAFDFLHRQRELPAERIAVFGESLGAAVAVELGVRRPVAAVVVESAFTSLADEAATVYPWLPVRWLLRSRFDSLSRVGDLRRPLLVLHSPEDDLVPFALGRRLYEAASEPRAFVTTSGGHNDGGFTLSAEALRRVQEFLDRAVPP